MACVVISWSLPGHWCHMQETRRLAECSELWRRCELDTSCRHQCTRACMRNCRKCAWAGQQWAMRSYTFKVKDIRTLSGPRIGAAVSSHTHQANDLLQTQLPRLNLVTWSCSFGSVTTTTCILAIQELCPTHLHHVCFTRPQAVLHSRMPSPHNHCLLHPARHEKTTKRTRQSTSGDAYVVGGHRDEYWNPAH